MAYNRDRDGKIDQATSKIAGEFLFNTGEVPESFNDEKREKALLDSSRGLEMRARIKGPQTMAALTFYGILRDGFDSEAARVVSDVIKRLSIADNGAGRAEAQAVLQGNLPKEIEVRTGRA